MYSQTGRRDWSPVFAPGTWKEVWAYHQEAKATNPDITYHIFPA